MEIFSYVSQSRPINWLPRERPGEAPSARQRRHVHGPLGRHATVVEGLERRVAVENRAAPRRRAQPSRNGARRHSPQGRPRSCRWNARQFEIRARERQEQEGQGREGHVLERTGEFCAQAQPCRGGPAITSVPLRRQRWRRDRQCAVLTGASLKGSRPSREPFFLLYAFAVSEQKNTTRVKTLRSIRPSRGASLAAPCHRRANTSTVETNREPVPLPVTPSCALDRRNRVMGKHSHCTCTICDIEKCIGLE